MGNLNRLVKAFVCPVTRISGQDVDGVNDFNDLKTRERSISVASPPPPARTNWFSVCGRARNLALFSRVHSGKAIHLCERQNAKNRSLLAYIL